MRIRINNRELTLPNNKSEVTLGRRLDFQLEHGDLLDQMRDSIAKMEAGPDKEVEALEFHFEKVMRIFSFFSGLPVDDLRNGRHIEKIVFCYNACLGPLFDAPTDKEVRTGFTIKDEFWYLPEPALKQGDPLTFGEIIDAKQMAKDAATLELGEWYTLLRLCAIFLRREGEEYEESFLYEGSKRIALMRELPLSVAEYVAFFLKRWTSFSVTPSTYLNGVRPRARVSGPRLTLSGMGGSTSSRQLPGRRFSTYREAA